MKKVILCMLAIFVWMSLAVPVYAETMPSNLALESATTAVVQPRAEDTTWYFRNNNGRIEKRLWSNTYCKWLTDWIDVGAAV